LHFLLAAVAAAQHVAAASPIPAATASPAPSGGGFNVFSALFGWIPTLIASTIMYINVGVHNLGLSLILLAAAIRLLFWPLNTAQFKAMLGMQKIAPMLKKLQTRYKDDPQKMQQETMALYKKEGVNPLAGCWPMLLQLPVLFSVYYAVIAHKEVYQQASFLWVGSVFSQQFPAIFATSLAHVDVILLVFYIVSQYASMRYTSMPPTDPAQAQQLKIMQIISPLMIGFFGFKYQWPAAMVLYWLAYNLFTMGQQIYMMRKYHEPLSFIDSEHAVTADVNEAAPVPVQANPSKNGASKTKKRKMKGA
jgi:YidC/Oxa1 family membrane protein insertase